MKMAEPPLTIEALDIHLGYLRDDVRKLLEAMPNWATKDDIRHLATKEELRALEAKVNEGNVKSAIMRALEFITKLAAAVAALGALWFVMAEVVHKVDKLNATEKK